MLGGALSFPRQSDDWLKTTLIGGVLFVLGGLLIVPLLPVQGLFVRVLETAAEDGTEAPVFEDWVDLSVDGLLLFVVQFVYALVPIMFVVVAVFVTGAGAVVSNGGSTTAGTGIGIVGGLLFLVSGLLGLFVAYVVPAAVANFAHRDEVAAAFDLATIREAASTSEYVVAVLLAIVVAVTLGFVAALLTVLVVGVFVTFYVQMVVYCLFGRGFRAALGIEAGDSGGAVGDVPGPGPSA
jgi:hypothetical protein